ncbi:MAG: hypothetical protein E7255_05705 [Lachnospiraceae bacterium]|nr:hypothetical protein [Lachnospiraceae bacterium]
MKAYNEYMNQIYVSDTLHQKILSYAGNAKPVRRPVISRRYAAAFACLIVAMLGIFTIPRVIRRSTVPLPDQSLPHEMMPSPVNNVNLPQPGKDKDAAEKTKNYTLIFNGASRQSSTDIAIPGHFWQELTEDELTAILHSLPDTFSITATANYRNDENGAALFNIDAHAVSTSGSKAYIQIAPGEVILDYILEGDVKTSNVLGTEVTAGYFESRRNSKGIRNVIYFASFKLSDVAYYVELGGEEAESEAFREEITELVGLLVQGGAADLVALSPVVPELRDDKLDLSAARTDVDYGAYLPAALPDGFVFEDARRFINQEQNELTAYWRKGMGYIDWRVMTLEEDDKTRITSLSDTQNYDLTLYPIPRADSVPNEIREIVDNPIFLSKELTLEAVKARTYEVSDSGDEPGPRMRFSVLYGEDILVEFNVKGASAEEMFEILQQIRE